MQEQLPPIHDEAEMSFLDHLEILRWHLIRAAGSILLFAILAFVFKEFVFDGFIFRPKSADFDWCSAEIY